MFLYNLVLMIAATPARWWLRRHPRYHVLVERFAPPLPEFSARPIWVQACSVGEVNTVLPLLESIRAAFPGAPIVLTSSTVAGYARAEKEGGPTAHAAWFPFDTRKATRSFVRRLNPRILILVETELWPNVIAACGKHEVPIVIVNGRLSDRHARRYRRMGWWYRPLVRRVAAAGVQSERYGARLQALGLPHDRQRITGNLKFDAARDHVGGRDRQRLRMENGFRQQGAVLFFGSTRPGDEALASACWATLREEYPELRLVVAPRHAERAEEVLGLFSEPVLRRSAVIAGQPPRGERVFLLDTLGEMPTFLSLATVAVVGGSFYPGVNGHNPLEPAALGIPTVFGPYMSNFDDPAAVLLERGGAKAVACPEDLYLALSKLLGDTAEQRQMGTRARKAVLDHQGATAASVALIADVLSGQFPPGDFP
jgi:3-deoxy-D-manno-octulosonic-acid transferase